MAVCWECQGLNRYRFEEIKNRYLLVPFRLFHCEATDYYNSPKRITCAGFKPRRPSF